MLTTFRAFSRSAGKGYCRNVLNKGVQPLYLGSFVLSHKRFFSSIKKQPETEELQVKQAQEVMELLNNSEKLHELSVRGRMVKEGQERKIGIWLLIVAGAVFGMIILGGYTRLSKSGLSMTRWKPIQSKYPQSKAAWEEEFEHYKVCGSLNSNFQSINWLKIR